MVRKKNDWFAKQFFLVPDLPFSMGQNEENNLIVNDPAWENRKIIIADHQGLVWFEEHGNIRQNEMPLSEFFTWNFSLGFIHCIQIKKICFLVLAIKRLWKYILDKFSQWGILSQVKKTKKISLLIFMIFLLGFVFFLLKPKSVLTGNKVISLPYPGQITLDVQNQSRLGIALKDKKTPEKIRLVTFYIPIEKDILRLKFGNQTISLNPPWTGKQYVLIPPQKTPGILWFTSQSKNSEGPGLLQLSNLQIMELDSPLQCQESITPEISQTKVLEQWSVCLAVHPTVAFIEKVSRLRKTLAEKRQKNHFLYKKALRMNDFENAFYYLREFMEILPDPEDPQNRRAKILLKKLAETRNP